MSDFHLESLEQCFSTLKTDMTLAEFADLAESAALSASQIAAVSFVFEHLRKKKIETTINTILRMSRLPLKNPSGTGKGSPNSVKKSAARNGFRVCGFFFSARTVSAGAFPVPARSR